MTYADEHKKTMQDIAETTPAFQEFSREIMNDLAAALHSMLQLEQAESRVQEETLRARSVHAISEALKKFREVGV